MKNRVIGTLEYYSSTGVAERVDYTDPEKLRNQLKEDMDWGKPVTVVAYTRPGQGPAITKDWFLDHVCSTSARYSVVYIPGRRAKRKEHHER